MGKFFFLNSILTNPNIKTADYTEHKKYDQEWSLPNITVTLAFYNYLVMCRKEIIL